MLTTPGNIIVHPFHGLVRVTGSTVRTFKQMPTEYLELETLHQSLHISVPMSAIDQVGLRPVFDAAGIRRVLEVLGAPSEEYENAWSRRIKGYRIKLQTGELEQRVEVMREIIRHRGPYPTPGAERDILREVRDDLAAEISLAIGISDAEAEAMLNDAAHPQSLDPAAPGHRPPAAAPVRPRILESV